MDFSGTTTSSSSSSPSSSPFLKSHRSNPQFNHLTPHPMTPLPSPFSSKIISPSSSNDALNANTNTDRDHLRNPDFNDTPSPPPLPPPPPPVSKNHAKTLDFFSTGFATDGPFLPPTSPKPPPPLKANTLGPIGGGRAGRADLAKSTSRVSGNNSHQDGNVGGIGAVGRDGEEDEDGIDSRNGTDGCDSDGNINENGTRTGTRTVTGNFIRPGPGISNSTKRSTSGDSDVSAAGFEVGEGSRNNKQNGDASRQGELFTFISPQSSRTSSPIPILRDPEMEAADSHPTTTAAATTTIGSDSGSNPASPGYLPTTFQHSPSIPPHLRLNLTGNSSWTNTTPSSTVGGGGNGGTSMNNSQSSYALARFKALSRLPSLLYPKEGGGGGGGGGEISSGPPSPTSSTGSSNSTNRIIEFHPIPTTRHVKSRSALGMQSEKFQEDNDQIGQDRNADGKNNERRDLSRTGGGAISIDTSAYKSTNATGTTNRFFFDKDKDKDRDLPASPTSSITSHDEEPRNNNNNNNNNKLSRLHIRDSAISVSSPPAGSSFSAAAPTLGITTTIPIFPTPVSYRASGSSYPPPPQSNHSATTSTSISSPIPRTPPSHSTKEKEILDKTKSKEDESKPGHIFQPNSTSSALSVEGPDSVSAAQTQGMGDGHDHNHRHHRHRHGRRTRNQDQDQDRGHGNGNGHVHFSKTHRGRRIEEKLSLSSSTSGLSDISSSDASSSSLSANFFSSGDSSEDFSCETVYSSSSEYDDSEEEEDEGRKSGCEVEDQDGGGKMEYEVIKVLGSGGFSKVVLANSWKLRKRKRKRTKARVVDGMVGNKLARRNSSTSAAVGGTAINDRPISLSISTNGSGRGENGCSLGAVREEEMDSNDNVGTEIGRTKEGMKVDEEGVSTPIVSVPMDLTLASSSVSTTPMPTAAEPIPGPADEDVVMADGFEVISNKNNNNNNTEQKMKNDEESKEREDAKVRVGKPKLVAIKLIDKKSWERNERMKVSVVRELEVLKHIHHPSLVALSASFDTPFHTCLVLEHAPGGELFDFVVNHHRDMSETMCRRIFCELASVVGWLHSIGLVHRDIKLQNILLTASPFPEPSTPPPPYPSRNAFRQKLPPLPRRFVKLADFGLSRFIDLSNPMLETRCGSEDYAAPELIMGQRYDGRQTDAWALGVVLYALGTGGLPFSEAGGGGGEHQKPARARRQYLMKIAKGEYSWPKPTAQSIEALAEINEDPVISDEEEEEEEEENENEIVSDEEMARVKKSESLDDQEGKTKIQWEQVTPPTTPVVEKHSHGGDHQGHHRPSFSHGFTESPVGSPSREGNPNRLPPPLPPTDGHYRSEDPHHLYEGSTPQHTSSPRRPRRKPSSLINPSMIDDRTRLLSNDFKAVVSRLLVRDPKKRATVSELRHMDWMKGPGAPTPLTYKDAWMRQGSEEVDRVVRSEIPAPGEEDD